MHQWQATRYDVQSLEKANIPIPEPEEHQLLVKVGAVSLNYRDKLALQGTEYSAGYPLPIVPTSDAAGRVVAVGSRVTRFKPGDRVISTFSPRWLTGLYRSEENSATLGIPLPGVLAEYTTLSEEGAVATPDYLSDAEASTLPVAAVTAWSALFERSHVQPGDTVLVQGTGGVSLFALQLARAAGARVIVTSSSDAKASRVRELGATGTINYVKEPKWGAAVKALTHGAGVDHALLMAGGDSVKQALEALKIGGDIVIVGLLQEPAFTVDILPFIFKQGSIHTLSVGSREAFEKMNRALAASQIRPVIDHQYNFSEVPQAFARLDQGAFGKIVINIQN